MAADRYLAWRRERNGDSQPGLLERILEKQDELIDALRDTAELHEERTLNRSSETHGRIDGLSADVSGLKGFVEGRLK